MTPHHPQDSVPNEWQTATQPHAPYYGRVLHELIDMGSDLARLIHRQACSQAEAPQAVGDGGPLATATPSSQAAVLQDLTIAFDRIARAIRRTIALAQKLFEPVKARPARSFGSRHDTGARRRHLRAVNDTSQPGEAELNPALMTDEELRERLDEIELDFADEFSDRPFSEIIADVGRDLGIAHLPSTDPTRRRIIADIAALAISAMITSAEVAGAIDAHPRNAGRKSTDPP